MFQINFNRICLAIFAVLMLGQVGCTHHHTYYYSHDELASIFVNDVNHYLVGDDLQIVKTYTLQGGYIVAYNWDTGNYNAYYVDAYQNYIYDPIAYFNHYSGYFYYGLIPLISGDYLDPVSGTLFHKDNKLDAQNTAQLKKFEQAIRVNKIAKGLSENYGMSTEKSVDVAKFVYKMQSLPKGSVSETEYDAFAKEITGSTVTEFRADVVNKNNASLNSRIQMAADMTGMGVEGVNKFISDNFSSNN